MTSTRILTYMFLVMLMLGSAVTRGQSNTAEANYLRSVDDARDSYRAAIATRIRTAKSVELFLLKFDGMEATSDIDDSEERFDVEPYLKSTPILKRQRLNTDEAKQVVDVIAKQLEIRDLGGGAMCHFPVHGIRIYAEPFGEHGIETEPMFSSTFCWGCSNFTFSYPGSSGWLAVNDEMQQLMTKLLPIPQDERDRFNRMRSSAKNESK